ncbi:hypothetical protein LBMAG20_18930 [Methylocystaceae bacterium]|nr:hypothetical protein LBMAG20_18930 [Methylocystaceae bacterium]
MVHSLKKFVENSIFPIALFDQDMNYLSMSSSWQKMFHGTENIIGKNHYDFFTDLPKHWVEAHQAGLRGKIIRGMDEPYALSNGKHGWHRWQVSPWYTDKNLIGGILISTEDVTPQKEREIELNSILARFELVQQAAKIGVWDWNIAQSNMILNAEYYSLHGLDTNEDHSFEDYLTLIAEEDRPRVSQMIEMAMKGQGAYEGEFRIHRKNDGKQRWLKTIGKVTFDENRYPCRSYGAVYDITEQKLFSLKQLEEVAESYEKIFDSFHEGIWAIDSNAITTYVNKPMSDMLGLTESEMLGRSIISHIEPELRHVAMSKFSERREGISDRHEFKLRRKDGSDCWVLIGAKPVFTEGMSSGVVGVVTDYSEIKKSQEEKDRKIAELEAIVLKRSQQN